VSVRGPVWVIVVAAGSGARFGAPKQYEQLGDRRVLDWSLGVARDAADGVVLVVPEDHDTPEEADVVVTGGATRAASVRAGLAAVPDDAAVVVVHDAARPAASRGLFDAVIEAVLAGADGALPGLPVVDTVKRVHDGRVVETLDRAELVAVQTPQAFRAAALRAAHADGGDATDDGALVEAAGGRVVVVPGDPDNVKVTSPADLARLHEVLA
jgi:2-C-methyl-D-erythritol 4-phosphate cytidylyltransferase